MAHTLFDSFQEFKLGAGTGKYYSLPALEKAGLGKISRLPVSIRIIDKKGPLANPADRDHCIQYMVAVPLIFGRLTAADYEDNIANDPRIDALRAKMTCVEDKQFSKDYHHPDKRSIANGITIEYRDGTRTKEIVVEYPIGHKRRRKEGMPVLIEKFRVNLARRFPAKQQQAILDAALDAKRLEAMPVNEFVDLMVI